MDSSDDHLKNISVEVRKKIIDMAYMSGGSHIGSALSVADILTVLYFGIMKVDPKTPYSDSRDRLILSKGHAASALYSTLAQRGFFSEKILGEYCTDGGRLGVHTTLKSVPGVEATTGSLGHGLPIGVGMAIASKYDNSNYKVFVIISDGECDEGSIWESALFASHHRIDNLTVIIDYNKLQAFGAVEKVLNLEPLAEKWRSFGWSVQEFDGHDVSQIFSTLKNVPFEKGKPSIVIANTIKGKGISFMENRLEWHYKSLSEELYKKAISELKRHEKRIH